MSMIEQQLKEIRNMTSVLHEEKRYVAEEIMCQAADTIEALSAKLAAANMDRSDRYYGGGWISDRIPTKEECGNYRGHFLVTVYAPELKTLCMEYEYTTIRGKEVGR